MADTNQRSTNADLDIQNILYKKRIESGYSFEKLSGKIEIPEKDLEAYENGKESPTLDILFKIITKEDLFADSERLIFFDTLKFLEENKSKTCYFLGEMRREKHISLRGLRLDKGTVWQYEKRERVPFTTKTIHNLFILCQDIGITIYDIAKRIRDEQLCED
jgi:transcriptional regulator with XRE-family HTH domain